MKKVLIANRGEIAIRIIRACYELGLESVAIYSKEDENSVHRFKADESYLVGLGKKPAEAYLDIENIIEAALANGCDAIHPGYGFLAENSKFARRCAEKGLTFVGPRPELLDLLGDKIQAKAAALQAGLKTVPGISEPVGHLDEIYEFGKKFGYPIMIKAAMGGGGRGMRILRSKETARETFETAVSEAVTSFGSGEVYLEKYVEDPKHIEIQILADTHGNVLHLFERDCSVQRRHQKVVEFAPCLVLDDAQRRKICEDTVRFMASIGYENAGTVEYLYKDGEFYFIEVNPRIQVEHTVTELITGIDIVMAQLQVARGDDLFADIKLPRQDDIHIERFAIQCRITTEDPTNNFFPDTGKIMTYRAAEGAGIRLDTGNGFQGNVVLPYYDSLLAKLCSYAPTFEEATRKMVRALREFRIRGVKTNLAFLENVVGHPVFQSGHAETTFIDKTPELLQYDNPLNRGNKILQYIADTTINGFPGIGREDKMITTADRLPKNLLPVECAGLSAKQILDRDGADAVSRWVLDQKKVLLTDTTFRDAHQSLIATRLRTYDIKGIAELTARHVPQLFSAECWGGATFDTCFRFLAEDAWERLRTIRREMPDTLLQMLLRGANAVGYSTYPDNVIGEFVRLAAENGVDVFRIFDSLNWLPQMEKSIQAVRDAGKIAETAICYTGDILDPARQKFSLKYYVDLAREMENQGAHILAIKDMAGVLKPRAAEYLVSELKARLSIPIHLHSHDTSGNGITTVCAAVRAGADIVDTAFGAFSGGTSHPSMGSLYYALTGDERQPDLNIRNVERINAYWEGVRPHYKAFDVGINTPMTEVYYLEMPGGQYTNLKQQAAGLGLGDRWEEVKDMYHTVNMLFGDIVKVTPSSKVVGDMALFMVQNDLTQDNFLTKGQAINFPESVISFFQGKLGQPAGGFPPAVRDVILKDRAFFTERPGAMVKPANFGDLRVDTAKIKGRTVTDEDVMSYIMYPAEFKAFVEKTNVYGDISILDTPTFFYGMRIGEAIEVELMKGRVLFIRLNAIGDPDSEGRRILYFTLNGQPREIVVTDKSVGTSSKERAKAEPSNRMHIGSTMPGTIVKVNVKPGDLIDKGCPLLVTESMKMETAIQAPFDAAIDQVLVKKGDIVEAHDLLIILKDRT